MVFITAVLLGVYFLFVLNHVATEPFFTRLGKLEVNTYDGMVVWFLIVAVGVYYYRSWRHRNERLNASEIFWCVNIFVFFTYLCVMSHLYDDADLTPAIALSAGYLATLGWMYTNHMNRRNLQRAHTMNVLMQLRTNSVLNEHRINLYRKFPLGRPMTPEDLGPLYEERKNPNSYNITSSNRATAVADSVQYMANLYEFISVGMRQGDLDETIIRMSLRGVFVHFYKHIKPYIDDARTDDNGNPLPAVYENFLYYVDRFDRYKKS